MRVRVAYSVTVDDDYRRAINLHFGKPGLASRQEVVDWLRGHGDAEDDDLMHDLSTARERGEEPEWPVSMWLLVEGGEVHPADRS